MMRFSFPTTNETMKGIACLIQPLTPNLNPWFMLIHCQLPACMFQYTLFPIMSSCYFSTFLSQIFVWPSLPTSSPHQHHTPPSQPKNNPFSGPLAGHTFFLSLVHSISLWRGMPMKKVHIAFPRLSSITHLANKDGEAQELVERRLEISWFESCEIQLMSQS